MAWAAERFACAVVSCSWALVPSAAARVWPCLTWSPTLAETVVAVQAVEEPLAPLALEFPVLDPVLEPEVEETRSGWAPKRRPYVALAATLPVATAWATTLPTVAWAVRYCVEGVPARLGPTTTSPTAPTPIAMRPTAPITFSLMQTSLFSHVVPRPAEPIAAAKMSLDAEAVLKKL